MPINLAQTESFSKLELLANQIVEGFLTGLHQSPFHGFSVEFAEHRIHNVGESTKNIDWKLFARTDKLYTKKYQEETNLRCNILLDVSQSMRFPVSSNNDVNSLNKIGFTMYATCALLKLMQKQRDAVGISFFDDSIKFKSEIKNNNNHIKWLIENIENELFKEQKNSNSSTNIIQTLNTIAEQSHKRSLIILFTDFIQSSNNESLPDLLSAIQHLKHQQHEVIVFNVIDNKLEVDLNFDNRPTKFVDLETGLSIKLNPIEIQKEYKKVKENQLNTLKQGLLNFKIDYVECDINKGFHSILLGFLMKRKRLA